MKTMRQASLGALLVLLTTAATAPAVEKEDIEKAIKGGVQALRRKQQANGSWVLGQDLGMTALAGLTLVECDVDLDDPALKSAIKYVRERAVTAKQTYSVALAIIFLDKLGDPVDVALIESLTVRLLGGQNRDGGWLYDCPTPTQAESERLNKLVKEAPLPKTRREPSKDDEPKRTVKDLAPETQALLQNLPVVNQVGTSDFSNTQFATLALWVARRHGLPVEPALARLEGRVRTTQNRDGGWPYSPPTGNTRAESSATMTGAGVLCLSIIDGAVNDLKRAKDPKAIGLDAKNDTQLTAGLLLLSTGIDHPASVKRQNGQPARIPQAGGKTFYFLWTLERVCLALDMKTLAGKDWYNWGAEILLANQNADGEWRGEFFPADICFALLFLRRANLVGDLTTSLKGKVADETTLKGGRGPNDIRVKPGVEEKTEFNEPVVTKSPAKPLDEKTEQGKLAKEIVLATGTRQEGLIDKYRESKGVSYTEALALAIPHLEGEAKNKTRDALAQRLSRMTAKTLTDYLKDPETEIRVAAALACDIKESKAHIPQLIEMLRDKEPVVERAALKALEDLTNQKNIGPAANATAEEREKAIAAWQEWWKKQQK